MTHNLRLWVKSSELRIRLLAVLLAQLFTTDVWVCVATIELPICYGLLWLVTRGHYRELTCIYAGLVVFRFLWLLLISGETAKADPPLSTDLELYPPLASLVNDLRADFSYSLGHRAEFLLSPLAFQRFGCSAIKLRANKKSTVVPVGCLGIYSVFDLRCELAHALVRPRSRFVIPACERNQHHVKEVAAWTPAFRNRPRWVTWALAKIEATYEARLNQWNLIADLRADRRIASKYGAFAVSTWIQRSQLAMFSVPVCLNEKIVPLAEDGFLLPISASCLAFHSLFADNWLESLQKQMAESERTTEIRHPILLRLGALPDGLQNAGGMDFRLATTLFDQVDSVEEAVIRNEMHLSPDFRFIRPRERELARTVIVPLMENELSRNSNLTGAWQLTHLPDLVTRQKEIALDYIPDPRFLLVREQCDALIPGLLASFLAIRLVALGWIANYSIGEGLTLSHSGKKISPSDTIHALLVHELDREGFLTLIGQL